MRDLEEPPTRLGLIAEAVSEALHRCCTADNQARAERWWEIASNLQTIFFQEFDRHA